MQTKTSKVSDLFFLWPYALIALSLLALYPDIIFLRGTWIIGDHAEQHYPWAVYLAEHLKAGTIPFWTNLINSGFPITAEGQIGSFYLPNWIFYLSFPIRAGFSWNIIAHLLVSGIFMFQFLRSLELSKQSSFFGTLIYLFGTTYGGAYYNITSLKVLAWFPLTLILADRIVRDESVKWGKIVLLGFVFSLQILAGYLQFAVYSILFTGLYFLARMVEARPLLSPRNLTLFVSIGISGLIGLLISAPQLALTFQLALQSNRANLTESYAYIGSFSPFSVLCLIFPNLEGLFASKLYLGVIPIFFACIALSSGSDRGMRKITILFLIAFLLALGQFSPLYVPIVKLFHFYSFRTPVKFIFFAGFFLSVLAAGGMEELIRGNWERVSRGAKVFFVTVFALLSGVIIAYFISRYFKNELYQIGEALVKKLIYGRPGHPFGWEHYQEEVRTFVTNAERLLNPLNPVILIPLAKIGVVLTLIVWFVRSRSRVLIFYVLSVLVLMTDLYAYSFGPRSRDYATYESFYRENAVIHFLKAHLDQDRYFIFSDNTSDAPLPVSKNMIYGLRSVNSYSPLVPKDYHNFFSKMGGINDSNGTLKVEPQYLYDHLKNLSMLNVKYILTDWELTSPNLKKVLSDEKWSIYENLLVMGRYFLVPRDMALLEKEPKTYYGARDVSVKSDKVQIVEEKDERIQLMVESQRDQVLLVSQLFFPGWFAKVDGKEAEIFRTNYILDGIPLAQGKHQVELTYHPFKSPLERGGAKRRGV